MFSRSFNTSIDSQPPLTPIRNASHSIFTISSRSVQSPSRQITLPLEETQMHRVEPFGSRLPVLVSDALSHAERGTEVSVRLTDFGWACLVYGRYLYVWNFIQPAGPKTKKVLSCKELTLPPSDLVHKAELVCVLEGHQSYPGVVAVSPEGMVRYWPNVAHEGQSLEATVELGNQECYSLTALGAGCVLATTTNSLVLLSPGTPLSWRPLRCPQGVLAGLGRRMSSFIFGAVPAAHTAEKQLIKVLKDPRNSGLYVLAGTSLQKWHLDHYEADRMMFDLDMERMIKDGYLEHLWNGDSTLIHQVKCWCIDIQVVRQGVLVLLGAAHSDRASQVSYAFATLDTNSLHPPSVFINFWLLPQSASPADYKLAAGSPSSDLAYLYTSSKILALSVMGPREEPEDIIDFTSRNTSILGSGMLENQLLFFTTNSGLVSLQLTQPNLSTTWNQDELTEASNGNSNNPQDLVGCMRNALLLYCHKDKVRSQAVLEEGLSAGLESQLDSAVCVLSREILDDVPASDPRWAEAGASQSSTVVHQLSLILLAQLQDKLRTHHLLHQFLQSSAPPRLWDKLTTVLVRGREMATKLLLLENSEKLVAAIALRNLHSRYDGVLSAVIQSVVNKRDPPTQPTKLTPQDLYYTKVSELEAGLYTLVEEWEDSQLRSGSASTLEIVTTVNTILLTVLKEVLSFRLKNKEVLEEAASQAEYIPWTSTEEMRALLLKQHKLTVGQCHSTREESTAGGDGEDSLPQHLLELADLVLNGYQVQLASSPSRVLETQMAQVRTSLLQPLYELKQYDRATALAEKYRDCDFLIKMCEETDNQDRLQRYMEEYANAGFPEQVFKWYLQEGKKAKLLQQPAPHHTRLTQFLAPYPQLSWLHNLHTGDYPAAHSTLAHLADSEKEYLAKKKTLLSLSKLACLASDVPEEAKVNRLEELDIGLNLVACQETLPTCVMEAYGLDPATMRVLSPSEQIELLVGEVNTGANEYDFKKALDIQLMTKLAPEVSVHIWSQSVLRDDWSAINNLEALRDTLFFRTLDLCCMDGKDQYLPPCDELLKSPELLQLSSNSNFEYLLRAAYEYQNQMLSG